MGIDGPQPFLLSSIFMFHQDEPGPKSLFLDPDQNFSDVYGVFCSGPFYRKGPVVNFEVP